MKNTARVVAIALLLGLLAACGATKADTVGLKYNEGPIEGESFDKVVEPGSGKQFLWNDKIKQLPIGKRDYTACVIPEGKEAGGDDTCDGPPIRVAAKGGGEVDISLGVSFKLATGDADQLRKFYEDVCKKFSCDGKDGWKNMLRVNFRAPIEQAVQQQVRNYTVNELYAGVPAEGQTDAEAAVSTLDKVQQDLAADLKENINTFVGGDFFCGPGYERSRPKECPEFVFQITDVNPAADNVRGAFNENIASQQDVVTARNKAEAKLAEAMGEQKAAEVLSQVANTPGYIEYIEALAKQECAKNPECTLIITDGGTGVNVNTGN